MAPVAQHPPVFHDPRTADAGGRVAQFLHLLWSLALRDLKVRYKQSWLGAAWAVLVPLSMMFVFSLVLSRSSSVTRERLGAPYAIFAYIGLAAWVFFASSLNGCVTSLTANRNLVTKVYFPREAFPLSAVLTGLADYLIALTMLLALIAYAAGTTEWTFRPGLRLLALPGIIAVHAALTAGIGMILAVGQLFYRDVRQIFGVAIQLGLFVSNVVFPLPRDAGLASRVLAANPLATLMDTYRACILGTEAPRAGAMIAVALLSVLMLLSGWAIFRRTAHRFAECI